MNHQKHNPGIKVFLSNLPHWFWVSVVVVIGLVLMALFLRTELQLTDGRLAVPLDDAYIHFQFARNISGGEGFSFNPGDLMPGSTAPLWTILLSGVGPFSQDFLVPALILSGLFFLLAAVLTYGLAFELSESILVALLAALGVIFSGRMVWAGLAGMETTAFAATSLGAIWLYTRQGFRPLPVLLFALSSQLRPEGHLLFALVVIDAAWTFYDVDAQRSTSNITLQALARRFLPSFLLYALISAPYALFSLSVTGRPLPNTFYAKAGTEHLFSLRTLRETLWLHYRDNPLAFVAIFLGLIPTWRRSRLVVAWLLLLPLLYAFTVDFIWHHGRYTMPLIPFQMIVAAMGVQWLVNRIPSRWRLAAASGLFLLFLLAGLLTLPNWARMLGQNSREILEIDVEMAEWLIENTEPDALVAVDDIGAIAFISQRPIFDMNGLVSPEMWPVIRNEPKGRAWNVAATRVLSSVQPDYLAIFPRWHWEIATNPFVAEEVKRFSVDTRTIIGAAEAAIYKATWPYLDEVNPEFPHAAILGDAIQLLGYDLNPPENPGEALQLKLYWETLSTVTEDYDVFVHVIDKDGQLVAQAATEPVASLAPTGRWQPGDLIRDPYRVDWPADLPSGISTINVGMYLRQHGARLPAEADQVTENAILLTTFQWPPSSP
jgi:hypothetical protein